MNNNAIGYQRDAQVVALVEALGAMQTEQIGICLFQQRYWLRKAQERLQRLFKSGRLRRTRVDDGYAYFVERQALLDHTVIRLIGETIQAVCDAPLVKLIERGVNTLERWFGK